ncbi:MAG: hypothetical protein ACKO3I_08265 [Synechococcales cyanobacterium]
MTIVYDKENDDASVPHPNQPMAQETLVIAANPQGITLPPTQNELPSDAEQAELELEQEQIYRQRLVQKLKELGVNPENS